MANFWKYNVEVSEELKQGSFDFDLGSNYHYIKIGATNVGQLVKAGILPRKTYTKLMANKPDGLILHNKNNVCVLVEYKTVGKINSEQDARNLIPEWYYDLAEKLKCKVICASDGQTTYWFHNPSRNLIRKSNDENLAIALDVFKICNEITEEEKAILREILEKFEEMDDDGIFKEEIVHNPQSLARNVWQKIWISTGKEPEKCLYNVVEIFIFKFLSDLGILQEDYSFQRIYNKSLQDKEDALRYYAKNVRSIIREMFPASEEDGTTIINGTIFVNEDGEPNLSQSTLFRTVLQQFAEYDREFGSFKNIDKNFKTRLYESFLRQSAGVAALGQYFTPRNVVKAIVRMANINNLPENAIIADPFCGVGGFLLELLNENPRLKKQFEPIGGKIKPKIKLIGYDKGSDEKDDQRTIILAKANMLIYLSDLLVKHKDSTKLFSTEVFNKVFHLIKSNLGTLGVTKHKGQIDLIITNPPYVTSGVSTIKKEIEEIGLSSLYPVKGNGLEGLAIEWIIYSLKEGASAYIIVPDGLLSRQADLKLRNRILETCTLNAVISLPTRTFFATPKNTYILSLTRKENKSTQESPVFTYLVSETGETRDAKRFEEPQKNDLEEMAKLYKQFKAEPDYFESTSLRCRVQPLTRFINKHWLIDRDWTDEEKKELGILEQLNEITEDDFHKLIDEVCETIVKFQQQNA